MQIICCCDTCEKDTPSFIINNLNKVNQTFFIKKYFRNCTSRLYCAKFIDTMLLPARYSDPSLTDHIFLFLIQTPHPDTRPQHPNTCGL